MKKLMITMSEDMLPAIDRVAEAEAVSRSEWIRQAVAERLAARERARLEALLEEGYRTMADDDLADARAFGAMSPDEEA